MWPEHGRRSCIDRGHELSACGLHVFGIVGLDPRCGGGNVNLCSEPTFSMTLSQQSRAPLHVRLCSFGIVDYVAPLVPVRSLPTRFPIQACLAPWWHCQAAQRAGKHLADSDHHELPSSHAWDLATCIQAQAQACFRKRSRRASPGRLEPSCSSHRVTKTSLGPKWAELAASEGGHLMANRSSARMAPERKQCQKHRSRGEEQEL